MSTLYRVLPQPYHNHTAPLPKLDRAFKITVDEQLRYDTLWSKYAHGQEHARGRSCAPYGSFGIVLTIKRVDVVLSNHIIDVGFDVRVDVFGIAVLEVQNGHRFVGEHFDALTGGVFVLRSV